MREIKVSPTDIYIWEQIEIRCNGVSFDELQAVCFAIADKVNSDVASGTTVYTHDLIALGYSVVMKMRKT